MPSKITLKQGDIIEIGGVPVCLAYTHQKLAVFAVASFDADGFIDENSALRTTASRWRKEFDKYDQHGKDSGNSTSV
jgi:hypothetical protein